MTKEPRSFLSSFQKESLTGRMGWIKRGRLGDSGERLSISLEVFYKEVKQLEFRFFKFGKNIPQESYETIAEEFKGIAKLLEKSAESLKSEKLELGWEAFNAAQRLETQIYYEVGQYRSLIQNYWKGRFEGRALCIFTEGNEKLRDWRKTSINDLLGEEVNGKFQAKKQPGLSEVLQAQQVLSEHHSNMYRRLSILRSQIKFLEIIAILAILAWILLLVFKPSLEGDCGSVFSPYLTLSALIFGVLGACISGIFRLEKGSAQQKIPVQLEYLVYTVARPLVGAVSALAVVIFVLAGILHIDSETPGLYLAVAFIAGFTERLLEFGAKKIPELKNDKES